MKVKKQWRYFCHICAVILIVTNSVFLIANIHDLQIDVNESTILLSVIGFLFAFAAINIYSIFNTNVDVEKENLNKLKGIYEEKLTKKEVEFEEKLNEKTKEINDLTGKYKSMLIFDREQLRITADIECFRTTVHAIVSTKKMNSQFLEWIAMAKSKIIGLVEEFNGLQESLPKEMFESLLSITLVVLKDSRYMIEQEKEIIEKIPFWVNSSIGGRQTREAAIKDLVEIINIIKEFLDYDFEMKNKIE